MIRISAVLGPLALFLVTTQGGSSALAAPQPATTTRAATAPGAMAPGATAPGATAPGATAPGGLYVGYYQEDPQTNPEDPMPGAFVLNLPDQDSAFAGNMFFTYVGCQYSNVGNVKGVKSGGALSGEWTGTIDNSAQSGPYNGTYDPVTGYYKGVYRNSAGKQFKDISGCIQYYIAPNGSWEMFPVEKNQPATFNLTLSGATVSWASTPDAMMSLIYVIDPALARSGGGNPVKFQTVVPATTTTFKLPAANLTSGKEYIIATLVNSRQFSRIAFASKRFTAP